MSERLLTIETILERLQCSRTKLVELRREAGGDILNLSDYLLRRLIEPVLSGQADMNIGIRSRGWLINAIHRRTGPLLSGIRCLRREIFEAVPESYQKGFRIEAAMNWTCRRLHLRHRTTVLYQLKHRVKEKKLGVLNGLKSRLMMFRTIFQAYLSLALKPPAVGPETPSVRPQPKLEYLEF